MRAALAGNPPAVLARRFRTTPSAMSAALVRIRNFGYDVPRFPTSSRRPRVSVDIGSDVLRLLAADAKRAGITTRQAAEKIIRLVVKQRHAAGLVTPKRRAERTVER